MGFGSYLFEGDSEAFEDPGGHAFAFPKEADEQVLGADVGVVHAAGFIHRQFHYFFGPWGEAYFALGGLFATADYEFNGGTDLAEVHAQPERTLAATPSVSRTKPRRMCSVPI